MDNYTVNNKQGILCSSLLIRLCTFLILSLFAPKLFAQLDIIHYVPPLYAGTKYNSEVGNHWVVLTTPSEEDITVFIRRGDGSLVATVPNVSQSTPKKYYFNEFESDKAYNITLNNLPLGVIKYTRLNQVITDQGLIFTSENSMGKNVAFYVNMRHKSQIHGFSLTSKGQAGLGKSFRSGHLHSIRGENIGGWGGGYFDWRGRWKTYSTGVVDRRSHFISVMATEDKTQVTFSDIKVGNLTSDHKTAMPVTGDITVTLNAGQSYVIGADHKFLTTEDVNKFNGTKISSDKPIAVNSGSWCGSASTSSLQDIGVDQIVPEKLVGNEYILIKGQGIEGCENPVVVATKDGTNIRVNGSSSIINPSPLNAGESYAIPIGYFNSEGTMLVKATENVYMYQTTAASNSQPFPTIGMNFIPPLSSLGFRQVDIPFINGLGDGIVAIYSQKGAEVHVNGSQLNPSSAKDVTGNDEWVVYSYTTNDENVSVKSNKAIYVAMSVADEPVGAAGYFSGFTKSISPINPTVDFNYDLGYVCSSQGGNLELEINSTPTPDWYEWYSNNTDPSLIEFKNQKLSVKISEMEPKYILRAYFRDPNMDILYNGDFAIGRGSFDSDLGFFNVLNLGEPGKATLCANPKSINSRFTDFIDLDGVGKMLLAHSSGNGNSETIWQQTISNSIDIPNHLFVLKVYGRLAEARKDQYLDIYVNNKKIYSKFRLNDTGAWQSVKAFWKAGTAESAEIKIVDANATGDDAVFALDSISFVPALEKEKVFEPDVVPSYSYTPYDKPLHLCKGEAQAVADISYGDMGWFTFLWEKKLPDNSFGTITDPSITGLDTYRLIFNNIVDGHAGIYRCTIGFREDYDQCGIDVEPTHVNVEVVVDELARITSLTGVSDICGGESVPLEVNVEGKYSRVAWSVNGVERAEGKVFNFNQDKSYGEGVYTIRCDVENACVSLFREVEIEIFGKPNLTDLQVPTGLCDQTAVNLTAVSTTPVGATMEYSWYRDDALIETNNLSVFPVLPSMTDSYYKVGVAARYNIGGLDEHTCPGNELTKVLEADAIYPKIVLAPLAPVILCEGESHLYKAELTTIGDYYTYLWETPPAITGDKTKIDLSIANITPAMAGNYKVTVSNRCGTENTTSILTVRPKMNVTDISVDKLGPYCDGDNVTFTIDATNANHYKAENITVSQEQTIDPILSPFVLAANAANEGIWKITAIGNCGATREKTFTIEVLENFSDPVLNDIKACYGENIRFDVQIATLPSGSDLTYTWTVPMGSPVVDSGTATLNITDVQVDKLGLYTCRVQNKCGYFKDVTATLSAESVTSPLNETEAVCQGVSNYLLKVDYVGTPTFAWRFVNTFGVETILGTNPTYTIPTVELVNAGIYYCDITLKCGVVKYQRKLVVNDHISATNDPSVVLDICEFERTELIINVTGNPTSIKWFDVNNDEMLAYADRTRIPTGMLGPAKTFHYRYELTGKCEDLSGDFYVTAHASPIIKPIADINRCEGDIPLSMTITTSTGHPATDYTNPRWFNPDGSLLGNGLSATIAAAVHPTSSGDYTAKISSQYCGDATAIAKVNVYEPVGVVSNSDLNPTPCVGKSLSLIVEGKGDGLSYQWYKGATLLVGETSNILDLGLAVLGDEGSYSCKLISTHGCGDVAVPFVVDVREHASITTQPAAVIICEDDGPATFSIVASSEGVPTYQWYNNDGIMTGERGDNISIADLLGNDGQSYYCIVSDGICSSIQSDRVSLTVNKNVVITKDPVSITIAENGVANFTVEAEGTEPFTYKWYENGGVMVGKTTSDLTINPALIGLDGNKYKCLVSNACSTDIASAEATLSIDPAIKITEQPVPTIVCVGEDYSFVVKYKNSTTNCVWEYNDGSGSGFVSTTTNPKMNISVFDPNTPSTLTITGATAAMDDWKFRALVTAPDNYSREVSVQVDVLATFTIIGDTEICKDEGASFRVNVASGSKPNSYVWERDGANLGTNSNLNLTATVATDKPYSVSVTAGVCPAVTKNFNISHYPDLVLGDLVHANTLCPTDDINLNVAINSGPARTATYSWTKDNIDLRVATATYEKPNVTDSESGLYKVTVEDHCMIQSKSINIDVLDVITKASADWTTQTLCVGDDLLLDASVTGDSPRYTWIVPVGVVNPGDVATLRIVGVTDLAEGTYECSVSGTCGLTVKYTTTVVVNDVPNITTDLNLSAECVGDPLILGPIAYEATMGENITWKFNDVVKAGETNLSLDLGNADLIEEGNYRVEVTNACGTDFSIGHQDVHPIPTLAPIADQTACQGENVVFRSVTTGENLTHRWLVDGVAQALFDDKAEFVISNIQPADVNTSKTYAVECRVSSCGTDLNEIANVTVTPNTILNTSIKGEVVYVGSPHVFDLDITGSNLSFEWHHIKTDGTSTTLPETTKTLTIANLLPEDAGEYNCIITGDCGVRFTSGYLTVKNPLVIITGLDDLADIEKCDGDPLNLNISVEGDVFSIQWFKDGVDLSHDELNFSIPVLDAASDAGSYTCKIVGEGKTVTETVNVSIYQKTVLNSNLRDKVLCEHENLSWIPDVSGSVLTYNWKYGSQSISTVRELVNPDVLIDTAGLYVVDVTGKCGSVRTQANLTVKKLPQFISKSADLEVCENDAEAIFTVTYTGDDLRYQWQKDGVDIVGANSAELKIQNLRVGDAGVYTCVVGSSCGVSADNPAMNLVVTPQLRILSESPGLEICNGESAQFIIEVDGNDVVYQWKKDGLNVPGENAPQLIINPASLTEDGYYSCAVTDKCTTTERYSNSKKLTVNSLPDSRILGRMKLCVLEDRVTYNTDIKPNINYGWVVKGGEFTTPAEGDRTKITWGDVIAGSNVKLMITNESTGCSSRVDSLVTLRPLPVVNLADLETRGMCEAEFDIGGGFPSGGIYWVDGEAQNTFNPKDKENGDYQVRYSYTDEYGCSNTTGEKVMKIDPLPIVEIIDDVTVGSCGTKQLSATTKENNIRWSPGLYLDDRDSETPTFTAGETTLYVATVIDKHGCAGNDIINVTVAPLPLIKTINDTIIGECKEIELTTNISGDIKDISWSNASHLDKADNSNPKLTKRHVGVTDYQINVTDQYGCVGSASIRVEVLPNPKIGENKKLCEGETLFINTKVLSNPIWSDAAIYKNSDDYKEGERTIYKPGEYELTVAQNDCELTQKIVMNPIQKLDIWKEAMKQAPRPGLDQLSRDELSKEIGKNGLVIFKDNPVILEPNLDPDYAGDNGYDYRWSDGSELSTLEVSESGFYKLEVKDKLSCISKDSVKIVVKPVGVESPNAFTPLSGNENDRFYLKDINVIEKFEMYIYNRWGELLYKTNEADYIGGWDGTYRGEACPVGTYVWVLILDGKVKEKGTVTLLR